MSKDEMVVEAFAELGLEASPADVKKWVKDKKRVDVGNEAVTRVRQEVRARLETAGAAKPTTSPPPAVAAPAALDVQAFGAALTAARQLVGMCGGKEAAKQLVELA